MHSMHQVTAHNGTNDQILQQQQQAQDQILATNDQHQDEKAKIQAQPAELQAQHQHQSSHTSMTVLETLAPVQQQQQQQPAPVLSVLDPVQQQQRQPIMHQSVPSAPNLHQLQPLEDQQQQQQHELEDYQRNNESSQRARSRPPPPPTQIEGIAAEGGGPIVQWLLENYEIADGESLPRSTVYNHYLAHCKHSGMSSVNAASFGKLIRSVFVNIKTRRLGTRGHSKYHYFGVRAQPHVRLEWLSSGGGSGATQTTPAGRSSSGLLGDSNDNSNNGTDGSESDSTGGGRASSMMSGSNKRLRRSNDSDIYLEPSQHLHHQHHQYDIGHHQDSANHQAYQHDPNSQQQQQQHSLHATNGIYYATTTTAPSVTNGYDKQDMGGHAAMPFAGAIQANMHERTARYEHYDLSSLKSHLGAHSNTLVDEHWPEQSADLLERIEQQQQQQQRQQVVVNSGDDKSPTNHRQHGQQKLLTGRLVNAFESQYKAYYKRMVELLGELRFGETEQLTMDFWHPTPLPAAHETIHWTSSTTGTAVGTPSSAACEASPAAESTTSQSAGANPGDARAQHRNHQQHHLQQQQHHHQHQYMSAYSEQDTHHSHHILQQPQQGQLNHQMIQTLVESLTLDELYLITSHPAMIDRITQIDCRLYSAIASFLMVDMLGPLPRALVHILRLFARNICSWVKNAIKEYRNEFINEKLRSTRAFEQALRRSTSINHLASASRSIWNKQAALHQMSSDLSRLDMRDIELQVSSLMNGGAQEKPTSYLETNSVSTSAMMQIDCDRVHNQHYEQEQQQHGLASGNDAPVPARSTDCLDSSNHVNDESNTSQPAYSSGQSNDNIENNYRNSNSHDGQHANRSLDGRTAVVGGRKHEFCGSLRPSQLIANFLSLLEDPCPTNAWPEWCRSLVKSRVSGQSYEEARNFILKWNFNISLILRELTLRSAPSLGSFQLIRLLFDEYLYYLVVERLAQVQQKTATQLLRPSVRFDNL